MDSETCKFMVNNVLNIVRNLLLLAKTYFCRQKLFLSARFLPLKKNGFSTAWQKPANPAADGCILTADATHLEFLTLLSANLFRLVETVASPTSCEFCAHRRRTHITSTLEWRRRRRCALDLRSFLDIISQNGLQFSHHWPSIVI